MYSTADSVQLHPPLQIKSLFLIPLTGESPCGRAVQEVRIMMSHPEAQLTHTTVARPLLADMATYNFRHHFCILLC